MAERSQMGLLLPRQGKYHGVLRKVADPSGKGEQMPVSGGRVRFCKVGHGMKGGAGDRRGSLTERTEDG